jgi:hypothetical protein
MDAVKLLLAFSPWPAFAIIFGGDPILRLQIAIYVAALMVFAMGLTKLYRGMIPWAGVIFFAFALVWVTWLKNRWVIYHLGILAH